MEWAGVLGDRVPQGVKMTKYKIHTKTHIYSCYVRPGECKGGDEGMVVGSGGI